MAPSEAKYATVHRSEYSYSPPVAAALSTTKVKTSPEANFQPLSAQLAAPLPLAVQRSHLDRPPAPGCGMGRGATVLERSHLVGLHAHTRFSWARRSRRRRSEKKAWLLGTTPVRAVGTAAYSCGHHTRASRPSSCGSVAKSNESCSWPLLVAPWVARTNVPAVGMRPVAKMNDSSPGGSVNRIVDTSNVLRAEAGGGSDMGNQHTLSPFPHPKQPQEVACGV